MASQKTEVAFHNSYPQSGILSIIAEVALQKRLSSTGQDWRVAVKLLMPERRRMSGRAAVLPSQPMNREFEARFTAILLALLTVAAVLFAGFNYKIEHQSAIPDDGAWWMERNGRLVADRLEPNGPAERAGIR